MTVFAPLQPRQTKIASLEKRSPSAFQASRGLELPKTASTSEAEVVSNQQPAARFSLAHIPIDRLNQPDRVSHNAIKERQRSATGLPDKLKVGIEKLSGIAMDDVRVHYHSPKPAQVQALAYTQGTEIHVGPGQEQHLAHEAWHVVQQKQGRVRPTLQMKEAMINDDERLEREADVMGTITNGVQQKVEQDAGLVESKSLGEGAIDSPLQFFRKQVIQLSNGKNKRNNKKTQKRTPTKRGTSLNPKSKMTKEEEWQPDEEDISYYVMAKEEEEELATYEEKYASPQIFWRGDDRGPDEVFETGFTTANERGKKVKKGANRMIWRSGGSTDDILPASAVCLAKDIRGSAFFPLTGASQFYLYAVAKTQVVNTFKAQRHAEQNETGKSDFKDPNRYQYDPSYNNDENASAVWQFQEYAAHRVNASEILACFKVERRTLVPSDQLSNVAIAGIQFRLEFQRWGPAFDIKDKKEKQKIRDLANKAKSIAEKYEQYYPEKNEFLSYMGLVELNNLQDRPNTMDEAKEKVSQVQPIVFQE